MGMKSGKLPESILKRSVLKQTAKGTGVGVDCALFAVPEGQILAWCAQEAAVAVQAETGEVAALIQKAANNLATTGAKPVFAQLAIMLPEGFLEADIKEMMVQAVEACRACGMEIKGGDTNVTSAVNKPVLTVNAIGIVPEGKSHSFDMAKAGQDIVVSKWIGLEATSILAKSYEKKLLRRYPSYLVEEAQGFDRYLSVLPEAAIAAENGAAAMHDMSQGGVFGALWELAEGAKLGLDVDLKKIPIRQETVEVCEVCGVNPYEMRSTGSLLITAQDGAALAESLNRAGIPAVVIGKLTDSQDRIVRNEEEVRFLDRPKGADSIAEACGQTEQQE